MIGAFLTGFAGNPLARAALRYGAIVLAVLAVLAVLLFLLAAPRSGERAGRLAGRLETTEKTNDAQSQMLAAARGRDKSC